MRILGIDPGLARMGWGVIEHPAISPESVVCGSVATSPSAPLPSRLKEIYDTLSRVIGELHPDAAAIEEVFVASNRKTAVALGQARGVAVLSLAQAGIELFEYSPLQVKQALVGYGRASKDQVQAMVNRLLGLDGRPMSEHASDALATALCHAASLKRRRLLEAALAKPRPGSRARG